MKGLTDLHRHIDGSLRLETLYDLADSEGVAIPKEPSSILFHKGMGLEEALQRFAITLSVLQSPENLRRVCSEICEDASLDGVETLELRFAPHLHRGAPIEKIIESALEGIDGRAGLILCGLYGDPPSLLGRFVALAAEHPGICGIDLAGGPLASHKYGLKDYVPAFTRARDCGVGRTVHAGEGRHPSEIAFAVESLHAQRIGHGTSLLEDGTVLDLILERGVVIEACPTSNMHTGVVSSVSEHPVARWIQLGVMVCVNTDNTLLSDVSCSQEYLNVLAIDEMPDGAADYLVGCGHRGAFSL
jgi:adenosine deaminase